ncbi:hypothetical protein AMECASPLE_031542 [Ameca splendens]|uniref:Uncharacterized protein n=1 Tax=Ameca splendens TaxID=208324 RepID=A0ABV0YI34_9TELE
MLPICGQEVDQDPVISNHSLMSVSALDNQFPSCPPQHPHAPACLVSNITTALPAPHQNHCPTSELQ